MLRVGVVLLGAVVLSACSGAGSDDKATRSGPSSSSAAWTKPADVNAALRGAAARNDVAEVKRLLAAGADPNGKGDAGESAYHLAASENAPDVLALLLRSGAGIDDKDSYNGTSLIRAAERGHHQIVGMLLKAGIDKDHVNRLGWQAIHEAIWLGEDTSTYQATVRVLVAGGVQLDRPDKDGMTATEMAKERGYRVAEKTLRGVRKITSADGALRAAAAKGDADGASYALRSGANLETRDANRRTPLLLAAENDRLDVARVLVPLGADPDALDDKKDTPWLVTGVTGSVAMLEALLPAHPDLKITNRYGGVSVIPASERGHVEYVRRVVKTGIDVDHVNNLGWTALLEAVILGDGGAKHQQIVKILLAAGADPTIPDKDGVTPLQHAKNKGYDEMVRILSDAS